MLGLQLWVNLPAKDKMTKPQYRDLTSAKIPRVTEAEATVVVIAGRYGDTEGATQGDYVRVTMLDVSLKPNAPWRTPVDAGATAFAYTVEGDGGFGGAATQSLPLSTSTTSHRPRTLMTFTVSGQHRSRSQPQFLFFPFGWYVLHQAGSLGFGGAR